MKKLSIIVIILFCLFMCTSCKKEEFKQYVENEARSFIDEIYSYIDKKKDYCLIDARSLNEDFASGHFRGFINYDIESGSLDEFSYKIESMYAKDTVIFIIDKDGSNINDLMIKLKEVGYKKIHGYLGGYEKLLKENKNDFDIVTGTDDCGC